MRVMGLDLGDRRIGLATGDFSTGLAFPLCVIERTNEKADYVSITNEINKHEVQVLVVGMPISMNGRKGPQADLTQQFIDKLSQYTSVAIRTWDERLTTVEASKRLIEAGSRKREKGIRDSAAASILLQAFLDAERNISL